MCVVCASVFGCSCLFCLNLFFWRHILFCFSSCTHACTHTHSHSLIVNINKLRQYDRQLTEQLVARPTELLPAFEDALRQFVASLRDTDAASAAGKPSDNDFFVGM